MTDILQAEEIPDSEARIICEVIEEEADILEDSLDSHWLQEDVSVDSDFKMDFSYVHIHLFYALFILYTSSICTYII